jgi:hypothetical protein
VHAASVRGFMRELKSFTASGTPGESTPRCEQSSPLRRFGCSRGTRARPKTDAPCQVVARAESVCLLSETNFQPVCRRCAKRPGRASIRIRCADRAAAGRERHRYREITIMSMTATAAVTLGIKALIGTLTATLSAAGRAYRALSRGAQIPHGVPRRARRRRASRADGTLRQTSWVRPEYLPSLARSRLLRMRGLHRYSRG